jgi:hypothetical protein
MISAGELYFFGVTVMVLVALGAALLVLWNMVREGVERWRTGGPTPTDERGSTEDGGSDNRADSPHERDCPHCGARNEPSFDYCQECAERL